MPVNGKTDFVGPSRSHWMAWLADQIGMNQIAAAQTKAYLKSVHGDGIKFPEEDLELIGGDKKIEEHHHHAPARPSLWPVVVGFLGTLLILLMASLASVYIWSHWPEKTPAPEPPKQEKRGQDYIEFY